MGVVYIACIIGGFVILWYSLRRYIRKVLSDNSLLDEIYAKIASELQELVVEINGVTDRNLTIIEERIGKLSSLLVRADAHVKLLDKYPVHKYTDYNPQSVHAESTAESAAENGDVRKSGKEMSQQEQIDRLNSEGKSPAEISRLVGASISEVEAHIAVSGKSK